MSYQLSIAKQNAHFARTAAQRILNEMMSPNNLCEELENIILTCESVIHRIDEHMKETK